MEPLAARQALLTRLGSFPERVPLALSVSLTTEEEGYTRTLVTYRVEAGEAVSAWLLMPQGVPPADGWPAVLAIHQHADEYHLGKAEPAGLAGHAMYAYGLELCRRGYAVLCPDLLCRALIALPITSLFLALPNASRFQRLLRTSLYHRIFPPVQTLAPPRPAGEHQVIWRSCAGGRNRY